MMQREDALEILSSAIAAVQPAKLIPRVVAIDGDELRIGDQSFRLAGSGRLIVVGAGKASAAMAQAIEDVLPGRISAGIIITKYSHSLPLQKIQCLEAGHPLPDAAGVAATSKLKELVSYLNADDTVLFLVSGGASALMTDLCKGIMLEDMQQLVKDLLASGATIDEINAVRKHLSYLKGGQFSRVAAPARVISLILSDVNGDPLNVIASGPTVGDPTTFGDALAVIEKYGIRQRIPASILARLEAGSVGKLVDTPEPGSAEFNNTTNILIGSNSISLEAARQTAIRKGYHPVIVDSRMEGEAEAIANRFVDACLVYQGHRPACLLMGGETTVTLKGNGLGGRNQHFVLAALLALQQRGVVAGQCPVILSGGTDGTDGPTDAAGAVLDGNLLQASAAQPSIAQAAFLNNDAYRFFESAGGLIKTGPTQTNVMDIVIGLCT
jgi:hydroxypyruvate reductase